MKKASTDASKLVEKVAPALGSRRALPIRTRSSNVSTRVRYGLMAEPLSDEALLAGLATGDPEVALAFVRRFQAKVYGIALAVVGDQCTAEDVAQQTFERVWRHAGAYDPRRGSVQGWIATIARNSAVDAARLRHAVPIDPADILRMVGPELAGPESLAVSNQTGAAMRRALGRLPIEQARAVVLAGIYGLSAREVADAEHIPLGTAKTRIRAAMDKLRPSLSGLDHATGKGVTGKGPVER